MSHSKSSSPHVSYDEKFYWLISKEFLYISVGMLTHGNTEFMILGYEGFRTPLWVATHFHIIEMEIPNALFQFKAPS